MRSIQRSLVLWLCCGIAGLLTAGCLVLYFATRGTLRVEMRKDLALVAGTLGSMITAEDGTLRFERNASVPTECDRPDGAVVFQIWTEDGRPLARSTSLGTADLPRATDLGVEPAFFEVTLSRHRPALATALRGHLGAGAGERRYQLVVAREYAAVEEILKGLKPTLIGAGVLLTAGVAFVVWTMVRRGLRPLHELEQKVQGLSVATLDRAIALPDAPAELTVVVTRLEQLRERLRTAFAAERRFHSAVAHELRTPLAELRTTVEVALRWPDPAGLKEALEETLAISTQMERLVATLLALHRADATGVTVHLEAVHLAVMAREALHRVRAECEARQLRATSTVPEDHVWTTDPALLRAVLDVLVSNAATYAPTGSELQVAAQVTGTTRILTVSNPAPELGAGDLPHLFEPFWRKDAAHSDRDHQGLGLTLARSYAHALGMGLEPALADGRLVMRLTLRAE